MTLTPTNRECEMVEILGLAGGVLSFACYVAAYYTFVVWGDQTSWED